MASRPPFLHAEDGQEAIDYLDLLKSEIDLAIIELELPVVSGLDVIWRLLRQEQPKIQNLLQPVLLMFPY